MDKTGLDKTRIRHEARNSRRGFSLSELMVVIAIIGLVLGVAVPSIVVVAKDIDRKQVKGEIYAAMSAARSRAMRDHQLVALHVFYDNGTVYQTNPRRWGRAYDTTTLSWSGTPHVPTNKMTMRLEVAYRGDLTTNSVEFRWLNDHDPVVIPDSIGLCQPNVSLTDNVDISNEFVPPLTGTTGLLNFARDFYIVFAEDGKLASVLVDYASFFDSGNPGTDTNVTVTLTTGGKATYSATGLCIYDVAKFKTLSVGAQYSFVNRPDNQVLISPYTGMPLSMEASK